MNSKRLTFTVSDKLKKVITIGEARTNYKRNGDVSSFEVDCTLDELALHKTCKSSDPGILQNKIEKTLEAWETKYIKHLKKLELEDTESTTEDMNEALEKTKVELENILHHTLSIDDAIDWDALKSKKKFKISPKSLFENKKEVEYISFKNDGEPLKLTNKIRKTEPNYEQFYKNSSWLQRMFRATKIRLNFDSKVNEWRNICKNIDKENEQRQSIFKTCVALFEEKKGDFENKNEEKNRAVDQAKSLYESGDETAIEEYCDIVLSNSNYPEILTMSWKVNYNSETQNVIIDYELPSPDSLPLVDSYKFVKAKNEIQAKPLNSAKRKETYVSAT